jgi:Na+/H+ antiporter
MQPPLMFVGLVVAVVLLLTRGIARRVQLPEAVIAVLLGVLASFVPGVPEVHLPSEVVLLVVLPPLVYFAGFFSDPLSTRRNVVPILSLAFGLTLASTVVAALVVHTAIRGLGWPLAIALGAVVAPPDPIAATAVLQKLGAPNRLVTILEGEGLVNDGIALTTFGLALEALSGHVTGAHIALRVVEAVLGGAAFGIAVGWVVGFLRDRVQDASSQVVISLLAPYLAYLPADRLHLSGVIATVVMAGWLGSRRHGLFPAEFRLPIQNFWHVLNFLLQAFLFVLLGLQVPGVVRGVRHENLPGLAIASVALVGAVIGIRLLWLAVFPPLVARTLRSALMTMPRRHRLVLGWSGLRGAVSLAIALAIPTTTAAGLPLPHRNELVFLAVVVILATLIGQGSTLPLVLRWLGVEQSQRETTATLRARQVAVEAALGRLDELAEDENVDERGRRGLRRVYEARQNRILQQLNAVTDADEELDEGMAGTTRLRLDMVEAQRDAVHRLYHEGEITAESLRDIDHEFDLEEVQLRRAEAH